MSLFSGDTIFPTINASHYGPMAMCVYDVASGGFRPLKSSDSIFTFQSGNNVVVSSGATINIINTGIPSANVTIAGQVAGSVPINVSGVVTGTINALVTNIPSVNINGQTAGSLPINVSGIVTGTVNAVVTNVVNITGLVTANTKTSNTFNVPSNFAVSGSGQMGTALAANAARKILFVQNIGMNPLFVKFGTAGASNSSLNMILAGGTLSGDGRGGSFIDEGCAVTGLVAVSGVQPNYLVWEA